MVRANLRILPLADAATIETAAAPPLRRLELRDLLKGEREAIILHDGQEYRLRLTANHKLILTK
ncbi:MAG: hemin uptake protein HemP [Proteobacteria bacterium]|nr:hemin uptake protein HemP [Pseudomonadota bacterium]